jgi:hypothetical protein
VAAAGIVVLAAVALAAAVTVNRSHGQVPERPAAAAAGPSTTAAGNSATGGRTLRPPDTLGGLPRNDEPFPMPAFAGGQAITAFYGSSDSRQLAILIAARSGAVQAPERIASFWAQGADGSPGTFERSPRDALDIRCAGRKSPAGKVVLAVCYLDRPDLQVVVNGAPPSRVADMVAEAYRKLSG